MIPFDTNLVWACENAPGVLFAASQSNFSSVTKKVQLVASALPIVYHICSQVISVEKIRNNQEMTSRLEFKLLIRLRACCAESFFVLCRSSLLFGHSCSLNSIL